MSDTFSLSATPPTTSGLSVPPNKVPEENPDKHPARMGQPWNADEVTKLHAEIAAKKSFEEIAVAHSRTVGGVVSYLKNMAYHTHKTGKTVEEIVTLTGLTDSQIAKAIEKRETPRAEKKTPTPTPKAATATATPSPRTFASVAGTTVAPTPNREIAVLRAEVASLRRDVNEVLRILNSENRNTPKSSFGR